MLVKEKTTLVLNEIKKSLEMKKYFENLNNQFDAQELFQKIKNDDQLKNVISSLINEHDIIADKEKHNKDYVDALSKEISDEITQNKKEGFNFYLSEKLEENELLLTFSLLKTMNPKNYLQEKFKNDDNIISIFSNPEKKLMYKISIIVFSYVYNQVLLASLSNIKSNNKKVILQYFSILKIFKYLPENIRNVLLNNQTEKEINKIEENVKQMTVLQKINFLILIDKILEEKSVVNLTLETTEELKEKDNIILHIFKKESVDLFSLNTLLDNYFYLKHYSNNIFVQSNINLKDRIDYELNYKPNPTQHEGLKIMYALLNLYKKALDYCLKSYKYENIDSLFKELRANADEFFCHNNEYLYSVAENLTEDDREIMFDVIEYLSTQTGLTTRTIISENYDLVSDQFFEKWKILKKHKHICFKDLQEFLIKIEVLINKNFIYENKCNINDYLKFLESFEDKKTEMFYVKIVSALGKISSLSANGYLTSPFTMVKNAILKNRKNKKELLSHYLENYFEKGIVLDYVQDFYIKEYKNDKIELSFILSDIEKTYEEAKNAIDEDSLKPNKESIKNVLKDLLNDKYIKINLNFNQDIEKKLNSLKNKYTNFTEVIDYYISQFRLNKHLYQIKPVLLFGEPGTGKTAFVREFSKLLNVESHFINIATLTEKYDLTGINRSYKAAKEGLIYQGLTNGKSANQVFMFDDIDKVSKNDNNIISAILPLFDKETASHFKDEFAMTEIDASKCIYIITANDLSEFQQSFLSRVEVFEIHLPTKEKRMEIIDNIWKNVLNLSNNKKMPNKLPLDIKKEIVNNNLRDLEGYINKIANHIVLKGYISKENIYDIVLKQRKTNLAIGAENFTVVDPSQLSVSLDDVKGCDEAKSQIKELIDIFKAKAKLNEHQTENDLIKNLPKPKGVILYGPPGVGKTMMAKSFAKEVNMPFIALSGSSFVEKYVGMGAKRVRELFNKARQYAPCIIYIDELDAIGKRGGDENSERDNTINELLIQLDGVKENNDIFLIGSTNYLEKLDSALIRAGRIDRKIKLELPYFKDRTQIIEELIKKYKVEEGFSPEYFAKLTHGASPAELISIFNQASIIAIRNGKDEIALKNLQEAYEEIDMGIRTTSLSETKEEKRITALHESGHAIINLALNNVNKVRRVTITPRANSLGVTISTPDKDNVNITKEDLLNKICMTLGGRAAEEIFVGKISTGASQDIRQVTRIANNMIRKYGFSDDDYLSLVLYDEEDMASLSNETKNRIEKEVLRIVKEQYQRALSILRKNEKAVLEMTEQLLEKEVIDEEEINGIAKSLAF